jgi:hypothetical protein
MADAQGTRAALRVGVALVLVACAGWPAAADGEQDRRADTAEPIGVLEVATDGVSQAAGEKFEQSVEETLAGVGFRVVRSQTVRERLAGTNYISGCTFGPCMKEVLSRTGLRRVLVARIRGEGQSYSVIVSLVETRSGHLLSQVAQSCPVCTVEEAISTSTLAVVELLTGRPARGEGAAAIAAAGAREQAGAAAKLDRRRRHARMTGWIFVAGGAVAAGIGGGLVALDRTESGAALVGGGGGLAVAGLTALLWSRSF